MNPYDHKDIEKKWQEKWEEQGLHKVSDNVAGKENFYTLVEFTYPSGNLHVGHWYAFAVPDIFARYKKMQGFNVLYPMGFDAFGLPAENAAIKLGADPKVWTYEQMDRMRGQFRTMGAIFPWDREVVSCDPAYYKWTQWMFNQFLKNDLVYRAATMVNWCPKDQTILANEQVVDNHCERCGTEVEQKKQEQWMLRITKYADRLIDDLDKLDWPNAIKESQKNWIGRSEGSEISFEIKQQQTRFVLLHGFEGGPQNNFFPWIKSELEKRGHEVIVPELPSAGDPDVVAQAAFVLDTISFDEQTVLLGHSIGGAVALKVAEGLKNKIKKLVILDGQLEPIRTGEDFMAYEKRFDWNFDIEKIKTAASHIVFVNDHTEGNDILPEVGQKFTEKLGVEFKKVFANKTHFDDMQEPEVLKSLIDFVDVFTTRADTLFGVTYIVFAPEHPEIKNLKLKIKNWEEVNEYIEATKKKSELDRQQSKEKTGIEIKGIQAINPANGEAVSVWIADYVLAGYGTGAVMAVPAHDERDFEFAKKYDLPMKSVIEPVLMQTTGSATFRENEPVQENKGIIAVVKHWSEEKYLGLYWPEPQWGTLLTGGIDEGFTPEETVYKEILEETGYKNAKIIKSFGTIHSRYYHAPKKINRFGHTPAFLVQLMDDEQVPISVEESSRHQSKWLTKEEMKKFLTGASHIQVMELFDNPLYTGEGMITGSGKFDGLESKDAKKKITEFVGGKLVSTYRLRDWGISRQRYWGTPIPIIYDPEGKAHPVPDEHLPWILPTDVDHTPDGTAPLARSKELLERTEKIFGAGWKPEVETMDTFVDSSWYFYRYLDNKNNTVFADAEKMKSWMPVDLYMGGAEHTTMHLLYSRFWVKALHDLGFVTDDESYKIRRNRGLILGPDGNKMSKSKGNVINPDEIVDRLGADTVRLYLCFMGPYGITVNYPWDPNGVVGVRRFLERVFKLAQKIMSHIEHPDKLEYLSMSKIINKTIKGVTEDIEEFKFNTSISKMMILMNEWEKSEIVSDIDFKIFLQLLAPFAPHITDELWSQLGEKESIHISAWPTYDPTLLVDDEITIAIQVNGKIRGDFTVPVDTSEDDIKTMAQNHEKVLQWIDGKDIKKVIYVKGKLVSIVI